MLAHSIWHKVCPGLVRNRPECSVCFGLPMSRTDWIQVRRLEKGQLRWPRIWWVSYLRASQRRALLAQNGTEKQPKGKAVSWELSTMGGCQGFAKGRGGTWARLAWINLDWQLVGSFVGSKGWNCWEWNILYSDFITERKGLQQGQDWVFLSCIPAWGFGEAGLGFLGVTVFALGLFWGDSAVDVTPAV